MLSSIKNSNIKKHCVSQCHKKNNCKCNYNCNESDSDPDLDSYWNFIITPSSPTYISSSLKIKKENKNRSTYRNQPSYTQYADLLFSENITDDFSNILDKKIKDIYKENNIKTIEHLNIFNLIVKKLNKNNDLYLKNQEKNMCPTCNKQYIVEDNYLYCETCGEQTEIIIETNEYKNFSNNQTHTISNNSYLPFKIVGNNSQKHFQQYRQFCTNSNKARLHRIVNEFNKQIYTYTEFNINDTIINESSEIFLKISINGCIKRKNKRKGICAACLYYTCQSNSVSITPKNIITIWNIDEKHLSYGEKIVREYNEKKIISVAVHKDNKALYITSYLNKLEIDEKYKEFIIDLLNTAEKKKLHIKNNYRTITKCIGAIYMLIMRIKLLRNKISKDDIANKCKISIATFKKYYNLLYQNHKKIKHIFKKHSIKMPREWMDNVNTHIPNTLDC